MFCPNCGNKTEDGARFCPECGTPMPTEEIRRPKIPHCPNCGTEIKDGARFCAECGTPVPAAESVQAEIATKSAERDYYCPECGNKIEKGIKFCGVCGTPVETEATVAEEAPTVINERVTKEPQAEYVTAEEAPAAVESVKEEIPVAAPQVVVAAEEVVEEKTEENVIFCSKCGNKMAADSKFCGVCGTPVETEATVAEEAPTVINERVTKEPQAEYVTAEEAPAAVESVKEEIPVAAPQVVVAAEEVVEEKTEENVIFCSKCGNKMAADSKFCGVCGTPVENASPTPEFETKEASFHAPIVSGEGSFGTVEVNGGAQESRGPGQVIGDAFKSLISSVTALFKNPIKLLPPLILAVLWLIINILQGCGINILPVKAFSFLTFAEAGMHGGIMGAIGGIIGKGMFAGAVVSLIGLFTRKNGAKRSFGDILKGAFGVSAESMFAYITGIGIAMLLYLFISGGATRVSFMGGVAAAFLAAKAALNNGFLKRLLGSFVPKGSKGASESINGVIRGLSVGFAASAIIGLTGINLILIILGSLLVIAGGILWILQATGAVKIGNRVNMQ